MYTNRTIGLHARAPSIFMTRAMIDEPEHVRAPYFIEDRRARAPERERERSERVSPLSCLIRKSDDI